MSYSIQKLDEKKVSHKLGKLTRLPKFIYTFSGDEAGCCIAHDCGLGYGINSDYYKRACPKHKIDFVDNNFYKYNHEKHLEVVKKVRPEFCTVRDVMTPEQCRRDNMLYYSPEQILQWAEELSQYAKNVIIIPKSIDYLPLFDWQKYMIGLPVPTLYASDMLPIQYYEDKKVHVLGGSFDKQLSLILRLGDSVVSIDNNWVHKIALTGTYIDQLGKTHFIGDKIDFYTENTINICLSLSFGAIAKCFRELLK